MKNHALLTVTFVATSVLASATATANLGKYCQIPYGSTIAGDPGPTFPWHPQGSVVPVYSSSTNTPWGAASWTQARFENLLQRIITTYNEQSGASVRLQYMGTIASNTYVTGAILAVGDIIDCNAFDAAQIESTQDTRGIWRWQAGKVFIYQHGACPNSCSDGKDNDGDGLTDYPSDPDCSSGSDASEETPGYQDGVIAYTDQEIQNGYVDMGYTLMHELGHAAWGFDHIEDTANNASCTNIGQHTVMNQFYESRPPAWRTLKDYDAEALQSIYRPRSTSTSKIYKNAYKGTYWTTATAVAHLPNLGGRPLFAMSSMGQGTDDRELVWIYNLSTVPSVGGGGNALSSVYAGPSTTSVDVTADGLRYPIGTAVSTIHTNERILAFERYHIRPPIQPPYVANSDKLDVCYEVSYDSGVSWNTPVCPGAYTRRWGVTATFDPWTDTFVIGFIADSYLGPETNPTPVDVPQVAVLVVPSSTNSVTSTAITVTGGQSFEAPSIACDGLSAYGGRIVYDDAASQYITWIEGGVNWLNGNMDQLVARTQGYLQQAAPSVAYNSDDGYFYLASTLNSNVVYSYKMASNGTSWAIGPNIWVNSTSYIGAAVLSLRQTYLGKNVYAWFPRFF